jgi:streptogramin lyase
MRNLRNIFLGLVTVLAIGLAPKFFAPSNVHAASDGSVLAGTVKSASGEKMAGVTVSAKAEGSTITTSVFTDEQGNYYFPAMAAGSYNVWAQADSFETARGNVAMSATGHQDFVMKPMKDFERQLTGDQVLASLPASTPEDRHAKRVFENNCTGCHQTNYILQNRFDADGWTAMIELMKRVDAGGGFQGLNSKPYPFIDYHEKELASYLARARGPEPSAMKLTLRPRPTGDAARAVITEYDVPLLSDAGSAKQYPSNNGSDWSLGTPSSLNGNRGIHDIQADLNGNLWFSYNFPNPEISLGKVNTKTGEVKTFKIAGLNGMAATGHGIARDKEGNIWFNITPGVPGGPGRLGKVDPNTDKIELYTPPAGMTGTTAVAGTVDVDGKDKIWATTGPGALRFDPDTKQFTEFKSTSYNKGDAVGPFGGNTYGIAGDADGNGWWAQMAIDTIGKSDIETGKSGEVKVPPDAAVAKLANEDERKLFSDNPSVWNSAAFGQQEPRRLGADKTGHFVWACDWYGGNLAKIDTHTNKVTIVPLPHPDSEEPYQTAVDSSHNVWMNMMNADAVMKYDTTTSKWTEFTLPTLGTETRYISLLEKNGALEIDLAYTRVRKVARMTFRTKEDLQSLKAQAQQKEQVHGQ